MEYLSGDDDDLEVNPMYKAFLTKYTDQLDKIKEKGGFICIPHSTILQGVEINKALIEGHSFLASPLFTGHFKPLRESSKREGIRIDITSKDIKVFDDKYNPENYKQVNILGQEEIYSSKKTVSVYLIDGFLTDVTVDARYARMTSQEIRIYKNQQEIISKLPTRPTFELCSTFLQNDSTSTAALVARKICEKLCDFDQSHYFIRGFEFHTAKKVHTIIQKTIDDFLCAVPEFRKMHKFSRYAFQLDMIFSNFVIGNIHDTIFEGLTKCFKKEDAELYAQLCSLSFLSPTEDIGLNKELSYKIFAATERLRLIYLCKSPIEILYMLQSVLECFSAKTTQLPPQSPPILMPTPLTTSEGKQFISPLRAEHQAIMPAGGLPNSPIQVVSPVLSVPSSDSVPHSPEPDGNLYEKTMYPEAENSQPFVLAGDDILPAFVCVLIKLCPRYLHTICFYLDNFMFFDISSTPLGYIHVSFKAAVEFIVRTFNSIPQEKRKKVEEVILEEEEEEEELFQCETSSPFPRQKKLSLPPALMNAPLATTKSGPLPGANTKTFSGVPEICVGGDPRQNAQLNSFLKTHERITKK